MDLKLDMRYRQSGFTVMEIMVVALILAVLGPLVVPKIQENVDKARVTRDQSDIRAIETAWDLYGRDGNFGGESYDADISTTTLAQR